MGLPGGGALSPLGVLVSFCSEYCAAPQGDSTWLQEPTEPSNATLLSASA